MSIEDRILDVSRRYTRELTQAKARLAEEKDRLWRDLAAERARLAEELQDRESQLHTEREAMRHDRARIEVFCPETGYGVCGMFNSDTYNTSSGNDVLRLNVGGEFFSAQRSTLCQHEGSYLANLFSGRWDSSIERDGDGRYFLDFDPTSFRTLLNYLRSKRLEHPDTPVPLPTVPPERRERFQSLVEYLGLTEELRNASGGNAFRNSSLPRPEVPSCGPGFGAGRLLQSASALLGALRGANTPLNDDSTVIATSTSTAQPAHEPAQVLMVPRAPQRTSMPTSTHVSASSSMLRPLPTPPMPPILTAANSCNDLPSSSTTAAVPSKAVAESSWVDGSTSTGGTCGNKTEKKNGLPPDQTNSGSSPRSSTAGDEKCSPAPAIVDTSEPLGWSSRSSHDMATVDTTTPGVVVIADTRALGCAGAVRGTRGFRSGWHSWEVIVEVCSDWSYVGLVAEPWAALTNPVGRAAHSWGVASSGVAWSRREDLGQLREFGEGSRLVFSVDMDARTATVAIDGDEFYDVFKDLPAIVFPAVSNCRSPAKYTLLYDEEG